jgi:hypothetical protein
MFKTYSSLVILLISSFSIKAHAEFTDKMIGPFLGPYKIEKTLIGTCPEALSIMAECTLNQLDLKNSKNLDFDFIIFKGINSGEMKTSIKNKTIERSTTTLKDLKLISNRSSYMSNYKIWFNEKIELELGNKKFNIKRSQMDMQNKSSQTTLNCEYSFDEVENKKILDEFEKSKH